MNREFLKELDLSEDVINKIMAENGKDINKLKSDLSKSTSTIEELNGKLDGFKDYNDLKEYKSKYETLSKTYEKETAQYKLNDYIKDTLYKSNAKNIDILKGAIDTKKISINDEGEYTGLVEQIDSLKESDAYLFKSDKDLPSANSVGLDNDTGKPSTQSNLERLFYDKLENENY